MDDFVVPRGLDASTALLSEEDAQGWHAGRCRLLPAFQTVQPRDCPLWQLCPLADALYSLQENDALYITEDDTYTQACRLVRYAMSEDDSTHQVWAALPSVTTMCWAALPSVTAMCWAIVPSVNTMCWPALPVSILCVACRSFQQLSGGLRARIVDVMASNITFLSKSASNLLAEWHTADSEAVMQHKNGFKVYVFLLHCITTQADEDNTNIKDQQVANKTKATGITYSTVSTLMLTVSSIRVVSATVACRHAQAATCSLVLCSIQERAQRCICRHLGLGAAPADDHEGSAGHAAAGHENVVQRAASY